MAYRDVVRPVQRWSLYPVLGAGVEPRGASLREEVCFVATDRALLVEVLCSLAERAVCFYVKYSVQPRDGIYFGRCFLIDEHEVGMHRARNKSHPRLYCAVQADEFTDPF